MKNCTKQNRFFRLVVCSIGFAATFSSCEKDLKYINNQELNNQNFYKTKDDATAAVTAMYSGLMLGGQYSGWGAGQAGFAIQASQTTDEAVCNWDDGGSWVRLNTLNFDPDFASVTNHYTNLNRYVSRITELIPKIEGIGNSDTDKNLIKRYVGELKALRAYFMQILYLYYGPVPVTLIPAEVNSPDNVFKKRPAKEEMIANIEKDFNEAIAVLPDKFSGNDYGRFSKSACYTSLMKLYMQEKRWQDAIDVGNKVKEVGFSLNPIYENNFNINNKGGNNEIILAIVCNVTSSVSSNIYRPHYLPSDFYEPSTDGFDTRWGGYMMPWKTYDKFDKNDNRLSILLESYPIGRNTDGSLKMKNARTANMKGAVMNKYGPDPAKTNSTLTAVDIVVMRYADVELLLAEALNELYNGPTSDAYSYINDVRTNHGKLPALSGLNKESFLIAIQNERLFELWGEGTRRDDLIRWGKYIQRAKDDALTPKLASEIGDHLTLYPLPRSVVEQSKGAVQQNPDYK